VEAKQKIIVKHGNRSIIKRYLTHKRAEPLTEMREKLSEKKMQGIYNKRLNIIHYNVVTMFSVSINDMK